MISFIVKYWIEVLFGFVVSLIALIYRKIQSNYKTIIATKNGMKILLKKEIIKEYQSFNQKNCINIYEKGIIMDLYNEYKNLGGNGLIKDIINDLNEIPVKDNCGGD